MVELLFWPALVGYGEAAVALVGEARRPGARRAVRDLGRPARLARADGAARRPGRAGRRLSVVELGRRAQPALVARRRRVPDLGLPAALPAARPRGDAGGGAAARARVRGRRDRQWRAIIPASSSGSTSRSMLAAFAGFTLAAGLAAFYLWHERRLKRREARDPARARCPRSRRSSGSRRARSRVSLAVLSRGDRPRARQSRRRRCALRRDDGRDARRLGDLRRRARASRTWPACAAAGQRTRRSPASPSSCSPSH